MVTMPIIEEFFRGIIFKGFSKNCPLKLVIMISAMIWTITHMNPLNEEVIFYMEC